jgi:putative ABC transport system permease protein
MLRTTLTALWSRKRRLLGTALSVVLGVAFLTATLVMSDSATAGFSTAFAEANAGTDALVRSETRLTGGEEVRAAPIDAAVLDTVASVDGVAAGAPSVEGVGQVLDGDGDPVGGNGPPTLATNWITDPELNGWDLASGRAPEADGEVVIDRGTAEEATLGLGDSATVLVPAPVDVTVVGIATFGGEDSLGGSTLVAFGTEEAQRLLLGSTDRLTGVVVAAADGVSEDELVDRLDPVLPAGVEAITGSALTAEQEAEIESDFLGFMKAALLVFAFVALLVAAFSIFNTFSILVAQRTRESALLRALGASRRQVLASAIGEAAIVGLIGATVGLAAGLLVTTGLFGLLEAAGLGLPLDGTVFTAETALTAAGVGLLVTLAGGLVPAWKASRVRPLAALRDVAVDTSSSSRWRAVVGLAGVAGGAALVLSGTSDGGLARAGLGALVLTIGVVLLGPVVARPVGTVLAAPLRLRGVSGDLAARNAVRNPRRTSGTAAALLVGVGVVSLFTVFAASVEASIDDAVRRSFGGDLVVTPTAWGGAGLSEEVVTDVGDLTEVTTAAGLGYGAITLDGNDDDAGFADPAQLAAVADLDLVEGELTDLDATGLAMSAQYASEHDLRVGDTVTVGFVDGATEALTLVATFGDRAIGGDILVPTAVWTRHDPQPAYFMVLVDLADGVSLDEGRAAVEGITDGAGAPEVLDRDEYIESQAAEIDTLLTVIYGLLAVAILIALMGIANTLSLSVHERTRELGLLRAVGQTRSQVRAMVRWESVVVATFGAVGGLGIGVFLGWGLVRALNAAEGFGTFAVPVGSMITVLLVGAVVGVLAGLRPAWRASRLNVLTAVATD